MSKIPVALLGATGTVGQKVITMFEDHPQFEITELVASKNSTGKRFEDACGWREMADMPERLKSIIMKDVEDVQSSYAISSLPADVAKISEKYLAEKGTHVISNASAFRMASDVPLIIPEINGAHIELIAKQSTKGKIVTNPNCSTVFVCLGLAPLLKLGTISHVSIVTLQALSGAGLPGVPSIDIVGNTIPNIGGEEDKIETEAHKILGTPTKSANFAVSAHVNRVPVAHGHTAILHVFFKEDVDASQVEETFKNLAAESPELYKYHQDEFRPQPLKDITPFDQRAHIGRIKQGGEKNVVGLLSLGHNLVRGAAGAAILNLEHLHKYLNK